MGIPAVFVWFHAPTMSSKPWTGRRVRRSILLTACLSLAAARVPAQVKEGEYGTVFPQSADVRLRDTIPHQETRGGANQALLALAGDREGGFAAIWRDQRDGMIGLYLARFDGEGRAREPERAIHQPHSGRRLDPSVSVGADGAAAVTWLSDIWQHAIVWMRQTNAEGAFLYGDVPIVPLPDTSQPPRPREVHPRTPVIAPRAQGGHWIAWVEKGEVRVRAFDPSGESVGEVRKLGDGAAAPPGARLAASDGGTLCAWTAEQGVFAIECSRRGTPTSAGRGELVDLEADPTGGYWALVRDGSAVALRHLSAEGRPEGEDVRPIEGSLAHADLAVDAQHVVVVAQRGEAAPTRGGRGRGAGPGAPASFELVALARRGKSLEPSAPLAFVPAEHGDPTAPRVAAGAGRFLVAWTATVERNDPDVFARLYDPRAAEDARLGAVRRLNTDSVSADQVAPVVAAAGDRGLVAWGDRREGIMRAYARRIGPDAAFAGDEFRVPVPFAGQAEEVGDDTTERGPIAMRADGGFAIVWRQRRGERAVLRLQAFSADGAPIAPPLGLDEGGGLPAKLVALAGDAGYAMLQLRDNALWSRKIAADGRSAGDPQRVDEPRDGTVTDPALAALDDGRLITAWTSHPSETAPRVLRGRFLDAACAPVGGEIAFDASPRRDDWDPALCATRGGFLLTWCSGAPGDPSHDVVARQHDLRGRAAGPQLELSYPANEQDYAMPTRLADGSIAVSWEDDLSGYDHTLLRRIRPSGRELGPIVRINELETTVVEDRVAPSIAPFRDGVLAAWSDRRRSKGWDIYVRILGPRFDAVTKAR